MPETMNIEAVVSSWPFRLDTVVYDPISGQDIAKYQLIELREDLKRARNLAPLLDPRRAYRQRATRLLSDLGKDQELLRVAFAVPNAIEIQLSSSDDVERELGRWASSHNVQSRMLLDPSRLPSLLDSLDMLTAHEHFSMISDWWEDFERPRVHEGPSLWRQTAAPPDGRVFLRLSENRERAWQLLLSGWNGLSLEEASLWGVLRIHWAKRLEFPRRKLPPLPLWDDLEEIFGRARTLPSEGPGAPSSSE